MGNHFWILPLLTSSMPNARCWRALRSQLETGIAEFGISLMPVRELQADLGAQAVEAGFGEDLYSPIEEPLVDYGVEETAELMPPRAWR